MKLKLNVYEKDGKTVKKVCEGETCEIMFGTIRKLMKLFEVENMNDANVLNTVAGAWGEVTMVLGECFPDVQEEDWDCVKPKELLPVLITILKYAFTEMMEIPSESKNVLGV